MDAFIDFLSQPWHWSVAGLVIAIVTIGLALAGKRFGISSSYEALCNIASGGAMSKYFNFDWKNDSWRLIFVGGSILGGAISALYLHSVAPDISGSTVSHLQELGISYDAAKAAGKEFMPVELFVWNSPKGILIGIIGGVLIGFGARWAGGCTSGHAITGMAQLQLPSLITVIGFFIGGLIMTHLLFPIIVNL